MTVISDFIDWLDWRISRLPDWAIPFIGVAAFALAGLMGGIE